MLTDDRDAREIERDAYRGKRIIVNDATPEKLHELMANNPQGLFVERDELAGLFAAQKKNGREDERKLYLTAWSGNQEYAVDRLSRGTTMATCCLSVFGSIQPEVLKSYLRKWLDDSGVGNDGFSQRFQLLVWPERAPIRHYIDELPNSNAGEQFKLILQRIVTLDSASPILFRFSGDAQELFRQWHVQLEDRLACDDLHAVLLGHLGKFRGLMPRLACLFALTDSLTDGFEGSGGSECPAIISHYCVQMAIEWCIYLESHAKKIYSCVTNPGLQPAEILARNISNGTLRGNGKFTASDVRKKDWGGLNDPSEIEAGLAILASKNWVRVLPSTASSHGGRPTTYYQVNPKANGFLRRKPS